MRRRRFLQASGTAAAVGMAGCLGNGDDDATAANEYGYETAQNNGVDVPLVPLTDAVDWHDDDDTVFVDTRDRTAFEHARIEGAVLSPAPDGLDDDPVADLSTDTRIVTYCVCPHHLATLRGASLIEAGYANTYAIDEGLEPWIEAGHPAEGDALEDRPPVYEIRGQTEPTYAGDLAWARHDSTGQREAVPIDDDGTFTLHLRFHGVDPGSHIRVTTPAGETSDVLESFLGRVVEV